MKNIIKRSTLFLIICVMVVSACACQKVMVDAESMVAEVFESIKCLDADVINQYIDVQRYIDTEDGDGLFADEKTMIDTMLAKLSYEVTSSVVVNTGMINVNVIVTNVDMNFVAADFAKKADSYLKAYPYATEEEQSDKMKEMFMESMDVSDLPFVTMEIAVRVEENNGKWHVIPTTEIENAVMGGLLDVVEKIQQS